jgi:hypothetical protein
MYRISSVQHLISIPGADTLTVIGNALLSVFKNSSPKPHDLYWFVGQPCIAQYHTDKKLYRGKVVGVSIKLITLLQCN